MTIAVLGAGIVGLCTALELQRDGHAVIIVDPDEPGVRQAASYGNGTWLNPGSVLPMSTPGLWKQVPGFLLDPDGPFIIRWRYLPALAGWLMRFVLAGRTWQQVEICATRRYELNRNTAQDHAALATEAGRPDLIRCNGLMFVYPDQAAIDAERQSWQLRQNLGIRFRKIETAELHKRVPELSTAYSLGMQMEDGGQVVDPGAYCNALYQLAIRRGATHKTARATGFSFNGNRLTAVMTDAGAIPCDRAVIAAGVGSRDLARQAGDKVPLISERGYHVVIPNPGFDLPAGLMPSDGKMGVVMTPQGLRLAGQVELASVSAAPNWRRALILLNYGRRMFPALAAKADAVEEDVGSQNYWMGHRPSTPDGLPCIGPASRSPDIFHAFGHGHVGMIQAPATGRLVAALIAGRQPACDATAFVARRFG
ncbi:FAD-binding oxidoreductase [Undibacter mobilis]|uniref:FAD-binding oxidoreductase n=1 Tax=Undibacter mobilis TaxID=2292256 RepID=A0A371BDW6_9BRAD|nr:FAD-binding oxidoreductase [Undibacter mobilis]